MCLEGVALETISRFQPHLQELLVHSQRHGVVQVVTGPLFDGAQSSQYDNLPVRGLDAPPYRQVSLNRVCRMRLNDMYLGPLFAMTFAAPF